MYSHDNIGQKTHLWVIRHHTMLANIDPVIETKLICHSLFRTFAQTHVFFRVVSAINNGEKVIQTLQSTSSGVNFEILKRHQSVGRRSQYRQWLSKLKT
jgi:hypothetical protein